MGRAREEEREKEEREKDLFHLPVREASREEGQTREEEREREEEAREEAFKVNAIGVAFGAIAKAGADKKMSIWAILWPTVRVEEVGMQEHQGPLGQRATSRSRAVRTRSWQHWSEEVPRGGC